MQLRTSVNKAPDKYSIAMVLSRMRISCLKSTVLQYRLISLNAHPTVIRTADLAVLKACWSGLIFAPWNYVSRNNLLLYPGSSYKQFLLPLNLNATGKISSSLLSISIYQSRLHPATELLMCKIVPSEVVAAWYFERVILFMTLITVYGHCICLRSCYWDHSSVDKTDKVTQCFICLRDCLRELFCSVLYVPCCKDL